MESNLQVLEKHEHSFTSGSDLLALTAAKSTIDVVSDPVFLADVRRKGAILSEMLNSLSPKHECLGDVRGIGLMYWGVEIVDENGEPDSNKTNAIIERAFAGIKINPSRITGYGFGNVVKVRPALIASGSMK